MDTIVIQLKKAILADGRSFYRLGKDANVTLQGLTRFVGGERGLELATAARVCQALNLELKPKVEEG